MAKKKTFINRYVIKHDGVRHPVGSEIEAFEHEVAELVKKGTLFLKGKEETTPVSSGMDAPIIGEPTPPLGIAKQLTEDPGSPVPDGAVQTPAADGEGVPREDGASE